MPGVDAPLVHPKLLDEYGPPTGVVSVSAACVHPDVERIGSEADAGPEPASVTVATNPKLPAAFDLK